MRIQDVVSGASGNPLKQVLVASEDVVCGDQEPVSQCVCHDVQKHLSLYTEWVTADCTFTVRTHMQCLGV